MAKNQQSRVIRKAQREAYTAAMRDGRRERAASFGDRRKQANKKACRGRHAA